MNFLNIDALLVGNLDDDERGLAVAGSIMEEAKMHDIQTITEFAHNPAIAKILEEVGFDHAQGFVPHELEPF